MAADLILSYPHHPLTAEPWFAGKEIAENVALSLRRQVGLEDGSVLAMDLDRLRSIRAIRVTGIAVGLEWHVGGPLTDGNGTPVLGVCEHDPQGIPDAALISINPEPVDGREELLLSTATHEGGHGVFEAPKWILATSMAAMPNLFSGEATMRPMRARRTITPDERHLAATPPRGSKEFFEEVRANEFMGSALAPRHHVVARLHHHCEALGVAPAELLPNVEPHLLVQARQDDDASEGNLAFLDLRRLNTLETVITRLARDFNVTRRFIEVRLKRYGLMPQTMDLG